MTLFSFQSPALIGIDIEPPSIKLVQLRKNKRAFLIETMAQKQIPADIFADYKIKNWEALGVLLKAFIKELDLVGANAAIHLPAHLVRLDRIKLAKNMRAPLIEAEIYAHLERDLPGNQESLAIDYKVMKTCREYMDIFFVAAKQTYVSEYVMCVNSAGLQTKIVEVDLFALRRAIKFSLLNTDSCVPEIILYVTDDVATLIAFCDETILSYQHWELSMPDLFLQEFKNHLKICLSTVGHVDRLIISAEKHIRSLIEKNFATHFTLAYPNVFDHDQFSLAKSVDESFAKKYGRLFLRSIGLAMREVPRW